MIPSAYFRRTVTDKRAVLLRGDFFDLTQVQLTELIYDFYCSVVSFYTGRCILDWSLSDDRISAAKLNNIMFGKRYDLSYFSLFAEGVIPGDHAKNLTQMRRYVRSVYYDPNPPPACSKVPFFSPDYNDYFESFILNPLKDGAGLDVLRDGFLTIYDAVGKKFLGYPNGIDCICELYCGQSKLSQGLYYGTICLRHERVSLDTDVGMYTSWLKQLALDLSGKYGSINFYIGMMRSSGMAYPEYWAAFNNRDYSADERYRKNPSRRILTEDENQHTYHYLMAPGWANILSPFTAKYLKEPIHASNNVTIETMSDGRLFVAADCDILSYDVPQAKQVKRILYDALFPGGCFYVPSMIESKNVDSFSPRSYWELTPVFPEEVEVYKGGILVAHKGNKIV